MSNFAVFAAPTGGTFRTVTLDGQSWFVAADVCRTLGINARAGTSRATRHLHADERRMVARGSVTGDANGFPNRDALCVSESGLYRLLLRSPTPAARVFQDWLTRGVLVALRKDGAYFIGEEAARTDPATADVFVPVALAVLRRKVERLTEARMAEAGET